MYVDAPDPKADRFAQRIKKYTNSGIKMNDIIAEHKADVKYPIVSAASIISKITRDAEIERIKKEVGYDFNSGYCHDKITIDYLRENYKNPKIKPHIRKRWETYKRIKEAGLQSKLGEF